MVLLLVKWYLVAVRYALVFLCFIIGGKSLFMPGRRFPSLVLDEKVFFSEVSSISNIFGRGEKMSSNKTLKIEIPSFFPN